jgi:hypothetical protein
MAVNVGALSLPDRLKIVLTKSKENFGPDVRQAIDALMAPTNLAILAGTLGVWAASHLFGVGEIIDVLLLLVGAFTIGWSITDVAQHIYTFVDRTVNAKSEDDLFKASSAFSHAVVLAGITVIMALLLRRSAKQIQAARGANVLDTMRPRELGLRPVGADPEWLWSRPGIKNDPTLSAGEGSTSPFWRGPLVSRRFGHRPRSGPCPRARSPLPHAAIRRAAEVSRPTRHVRLSSVGVPAVSGGSDRGDRRSTAGQRVQRSARRDPVSGRQRYVTITDLVTEGAAIGTITAGTQIFQVQFVPKEPDATPADPRYAVCR